VAEQPHYRDWIIFKCKKLRSLDFDRVKEQVSRFISWCSVPALIASLVSPQSIYHDNQDRTRAHSLFLSSDGTPTALATSFASAAASNGAANAPSLVANGAKTFEPGVEVSAAGAGKAGRLLSKEEKERVRAAIEGAESVEEVSLRFAVDWVWLARFWRWEPARWGENRGHRADSPSSQIRRLQRMLAQGFVYVILRPLSASPVPSLTLSHQPQPNGERSQGSRAQEGRRQGQDAAEWGGDGGE
jgi:hypothetical protein